VSRLPSRLQPLWPLAKRAHRATARVAGAAGRRVPGDRPVPRTSTATCRETVAVEPGTAAVHQAAPEQVVRRPRPAGHPADHWYFADVLETTVPEQLVLDLADGWVLGAHAAVMTAGRVMDGETSHYFNIDDWREHPVFLNVRPRRSEYVDGTVAVLAARGTGHNYYHFLVDALPRLGMLDRALPDVRPDRWVLDRTARYQRELLALLGLEDVPAIEPHGGMAVQARRLLVPSLPNASTIVAPDTVSWLRDRLKPRDPAGRPGRLYVTRGDRPNTRRVVDEQALLDRLARRGFVAIDPGTLSVQEQIDHFAAAEVVVAPHGAALTNLAFAGDGVRVLELFAPGYLNGGYWSITASIPDSRYRYLVADEGARQVPGAVAKHFMDDIAISPRQVDDALDVLLQEG